MREVGGISHYLLGVVVAEDSRCDELRERMRELHTRGPKLHWRDLEGAEQARVIASIAAFDAYHVVVVGAPVNPRKQERARALCIQRMLWELERQGVTRLTLESRGRSLDGADMRTVERMRGAQSLGRSLRVFHALPSGEPMLWVADQTLGAYGESIANRSQFFEPTRSATTIVDIRL